VTNDLALYWLGAMLKGATAPPSGKWKTWVALSDACRECKKRNGTIYAADKAPEKDIPLHPHCRCRIVYLPAIRAGTATIDGEQGADWYLLKTSKLPRNYLTTAQAFSLGWERRKGNLDDVLPGVLIGGDVFWNVKGKLPSASGRVWYEADINYTGGYRGTDRILFCNDGLVFVTYDHYDTFFEIVK